MEKMIVGIFGLLLAHTAAAQVVMGGFKPWYITHGSTTGADVADLDGAVQRGGNVRMQNAHYFPQTVSFSIGQGAQAQTKKADYILQVKDYKCGTVGSVKTRTEDYYLIGSTTPVYSTGIQYEAVYKIEPATSATGRQWAAVCKGSRAKDIIPVTVLVPNVPYNITHEMVIAPIRQQIKNQLQKTQAANISPTDL